MLHADDVSGPAEAVRRFSLQIAAKGAAAPHRIVAEVQGFGGLNVLSAAETAIADLWSGPVLRELVWLKQASGSQRDTLYLQAFAPDGTLVCEAAFPLADLDGVRSTGGHGRWAARG